MKQIPLLPSEPVGFPDPSTALEDPDGLLAAGGALTPKWLIEAYGVGIFPWFERDDGPVYWWSPSERGVMQPGAMRITRSLAKRIRNSGFSVTFDQRFAEVVQQCAQARALTVGTWITSGMQQAYCELHQNGFAHSVEVWDQDELVGGLYGLSLGQMFFGESMFSSKPDASKIAFYHLDQKLVNWSFTLLDCQMMNPHLASLGVVPMHREDFLDLLASNDLSKTKLGCWDAQQASVHTQVGVQ